MSDHVDVAIIGGGIAGSALGLALARTGIGVSILERSDVHVDRVRGEWLAPWGVVEAQQLDIYDLFMRAGGHHVAQHIGFGEGIDLELARALALDLTTLFPGVRGPLCLGHPTMCNVLNQAAEQAGATLWRGVHDIQVLGGGVPEVTFRVNGIEHRRRPRLVVGADGRNSIVRQQVGIGLQKDPPHHLMAGLLVEETNGWPADLQTIGVEGDVNFFVFPQAGKRARLYLCYSYDHRKRFAGRDAATNFLAAFRLRSVPGSEHIAAAKPAGPCNAYPNEDTWTESPAVPGVVLVGDAAGHNDPVIGQGLSIALRDVRIVRDLLLTNKEWTPDIFTTYVTERAERMRRLRFTASLVSAIYVEFGADAQARRERALNRQMTDPEAAQTLLAPIVGPDALPAQAFAQATWDRLLSA